MRSAVGSPSTRTTPVGRADEAHRVRKSVVLPEPFGPRTATVSRSAERRGRRREDLAIAVAGDGRRGTRGAAAPARWARWVRSVRARSVRPRRPLHQAPHPGCRLARAGPARGSTSNGSLTTAGSATRRNPSRSPRYEIAPSSSIQHPIRSQLERLLDAVLDDHDRLALVGELAERREEPGRRRRVEVGERLVDDEQPRPQHQDPGDREQLPLAAGELGRLPPQRGARSGPAGRPRRIRSRISSRAIPRFSGPNASSALDRRPDDLLGRVLEHGPDGQRRSSRSGSFAAGLAVDHDARRPARPGRRAGSAR